MTDRVKYHLDEHISHAIAEALRRRRINVATTAEAHLISQSDQSQLDFCRKQGRVMVTANSDFIDLANQQSHAGIVFWPRADIEAGAMVRWLVLLWEVYLASEMAGRVEYF